MRKLIRQIGMGMLRHARLFGWLLLSAAASTVLPAQEPSAAPLGSVEELPAPAQEQLPSILESNSEESAPLQAPPQPAPATAIPATDPNTPAGDGASGSGDRPYEVLQQGPVHEAFAHVHSDVSELSSVVAELAPPQPLDEMAPAEMPEGNDVRWIPGYWHWNSEAGGYEWISGMYRDIPPGRVWIPGYWSQVDGGYVRVPGYWGAADGTTAYLPAPPASIENGPNTTAPNADSFWLPGHWSYGNGQYSWTDGYWTAQHEKWIWQPACYIGTPQGYVFVPGYWDYDPIFRGTLYAPVVFSSPAYLATGFRFTPIYRISSRAHLLLHLFARPSHHHLYFGNYYSASYRAAGFNPWYLGTRPAYHTASLLSYYDWKYRRSGIEFRSTMAQFDRYFQANPASLPPQLFSVSNAIVATRPSGRVSPSAVANLPTFDSFVRSGLSNISAVRSASARQPIPNVRSSIASGAAAGLTPSARTTPNSSGMIGPFYRTPNSNQSAAGQRGNGQNPRTGSATPDARVSRLYGVGPGSITPGSGISGSGISGSRTNSLSRQLAPTGTARGIAPNARALPQAPSVRRIPPVGFPSPSSFRPPFPMPPFGPPTLLPGAIPRGISPGSSARLPRASSPFSGGANPTSGVSPRTGGSGRTSGATGPFGGRLGGRRGN